MKTTPACETSPKRRQNVSIAAFALYFASLEVGRKALRAPYSAVSSWWSFQRSSAPALPAESDLQESTRRSYRDYRKDKHRPTYTDSLEDT